MSKSKIVRSCIENLNNLSKLALIKQLEEIVSLYLA